MSRNNRGSGVNHSLDWRGWTTCGKLVTTVLSKGRGCVYILPICIIHHAPYMHHAPYVHQAPWIQAWCTFHVSCNLYHTCIMHHIWCMIHVWHKLHDSWKTHDSSAYTISWYSLRKVDYIWYWRTCKFCVTYLLTYFMHRAPYVHRAPNMHHAPNMHLVSCTIRTYINTACTTMNAYRSNASI